MSERYPHPAAAGMALDSFHQFPKIPIEIRLQIWTLSLPGPQKHGPLLNSSIAAKQFQPEDPVALKVNRESRQVALRYYSKRDPRNLERWRERDRFPYSSYIDFAIDKVILPEAHVRFWLTNTRSFERNGTYFRCQTAADIREEDLGSRFFSMAEMGKIANMEIWSPDFDHVNRDLLKWLEDWLPVLASLKDLSFKFLLNYGGDVHTSWNGISTPVKEKLDEANSVVREFMESFKAQKAVEGIGWDMPAFKVDVLRLKRQQSQYTLDL
jgi:hypothetical protein